MRQRKFGEKDFALLHPGGNLGERLNLRVRDIMRSPADVPAISPEATVRDFLAIMDAQKSDFSLVLHGDGTLAGMITDHDLRRGDIGSPQFLAKLIETFLTSDPMVISEEASAGDAVRFMMEKNLLALPVLEGERKVKGVVTLRDILNRADLRVF
jgi:arabinose-5-phosphate isomerase